MDRSIHGHELEADLEDEAPPVLPRHSPIPSQDERSTVQRFVVETGEKTAMPKVDAFLAEIDAVCRKHGLSISHEDGHGGFIIEPYGDWNRDWLASASVAKDVAASAKSDG